MFTLSLTAAVAELAIAGINRRLNVATIVRTCFFIVPDPSGLLGLRLKLRGH
jgi:hypothetical protein